MKWITIAAVVSVLPLAMACDRNEPREVEIDEAAELQGANTEMDETEVTPGGDVSGMENTTGESAAGYNEELDDDEPIGPGAATTGSGAGSDASARGTGTASGAAASGSATAGGSASGSMNAGNQGSSAQGNSASGNVDAGVSRQRQNVELPRLEHGAVPHTDVNSEGGGGE